MVQVIIPERVIYFVVYPSVGIVVPTGVLVQYFRKISFLILKDHLSLPPLCPAVELVF